MPRVSIRLATKLPKPSETQLYPAGALRSVTSRFGKGVYASSDTLYKGAIFGRDSLEVAEDLMYLRPRLVKNILLTIASLQGETANTINEEEPGKIIHEYRTEIVDGRRIQNTPRRIFHELAAKWGGTNYELAYYGSVDSTPLFLRVLNTYITAYGTKLLKQQVVLRSGKKIRVNDVAELAVQWLLKKLEESHSGLLEFQKQNPHGISNQVWKDSEEFYVHRNRQMANHHAPIASIEVQALTFDALIAAARLLPENAQQYRRAALKLRDRTVELLWNERKKYFCLGIDYDTKGHLRTIKTLTANPAALLDSCIFDFLAPAKRRKYVTALVLGIMGQDFLTDAGVRSRALSEQRLVNHWDYHGSFVSWPKESFDIAKGLRRQGFTLLAEQLENRILNVCLKYRGYPEFVYVDAKGRVLASAPSAHSHGELMLIEGTNRAERVQAWTVSAVMAITSRRLKQRLNIKRSIYAQETWQEELEQNLLAGIPIIKRHLNPFALSTRYPTYRYKLQNKKSER